MDRDLINRYIQMKQAQNQEPVLEAVKTEISMIPQIDTDAIVRDIHNALLPILNTQNAISEERKTAVLSEFKAISEEIEEKLGEASDKQEKALSMLVQVLTGISKEIQAIEMPETDLSPLEKLIKAIKPTSTKAVEQKIDNLTNAIREIKFPQTKVDLKPILEAINKPRTKTVEFTVETDNYDFPTKVIAKETTR
jgi:hypothetical protein